MTLPKWLDKELDKALDKYETKENYLRHREGKDFHNGFNAAASIFLERERVAREALEDIQKPAAGEFKTTIAQQALTKLRGEEE